MGKKFKQPAPQGAFKQSFKGYKKRGTEAPDITQEELTKAIARFKKKGNTITKLPDEVTVPNNRLWAESVYENIFESP